MPYRNPASSHIRPNAEGPDTLRAADHTAVAAWLAHVEAGRITGNPPPSDEHRGRILVNERLMLGDRRLPRG
jgi:hypothetical protein